LDVVKDSTTRIKKEIEEEQKEREENYETLMSLLEEKQLQNF